MELTKMASNQNRQNNAQKQQHNMFASFIYYYYLFAWFFHFSSSSSPHPSWFVASRLGTVQRSVQIAHAVQCSSILQKIFCFTKTKDDGRDKWRYTHSTHTHTAYNIHALATEAHTANRSIILLREKYWMWTEWSAKKPYGIFGCVSSPEK